MCCILLALLVFVSSSGSSKITCRSRSSSGSSRVVLVLVVLLAVVVVTVAVVEIDVTWYILVKLAATRFSKHLRDVQNRVHKPVSIRDMLVRSRISASHDSETRPCRRPRCKTCTYVSQSSESNTPRGVSQLLTHLPALIAT
ncbi:hypothetical protein ElyMa_007009300 [Elysia marginata]|uniref:Secreted protein n=1 Tax=Elysia marginata TaxID=1093978 RepID=A0AAV4JSF3_9GAST|nr:hypothetical protein ElyMa_007009300 [Elysia marginata]